MVKFVSVILSLMFVVTSANISGFYKGQVSLGSLGSKTYYTLDGTVPTFNSKVVNKQLIITNNLPYNTYYTIPTNPPSTSKFFRWKEPEVPQVAAHIVRLSDTNKLQDSINTFLFFDKPEISLPIISLITDPENVFDDESGIYVPGHSFKEGENWVTDGNYHFKGKEWERPIYFEYFDKNGTLQFSQRCGFRIHGKNSRLYPMKSLRLYGRSEYGKKYFEYPLFKNDSKNKFKRLILRNSGQDFLRTMFADVLMHKISKEMKLKRQHSQPVNLFLNGNYWGIHNLRERFDKHYLKDYHGGSKEDIDLIESLGPTVEVLEGDGKAYWEIVDFLNKHSLSNDEYYHRFVSMIDLDNFIDYHIAKIYFACHDWPAGNVKMWKPFNGIWEWLLVDNDDGFFNYLFNSIDHALSKEITYANPLESTLFFRKARENKDFVSSFLTRFEYHLNTTFKPENIIPIIDSLESLYAPDMEKHIGRWGYPVSISVWRENVNIFRYFAQKRPTFICEHIKKEFGKELDLKKLEDQKPEHAFKVVQKGAFLHILSNTELTGYDIQLFDVSGKLLKKIKYSDTFTISDIAQKVLVLEIVTGNRILFSKKLILE